MSALKKGALLKAFAGKLADAEKVALPYDGRVVLKNTGREVQTTSATRPFLASSTSFPGYATCHATLLDLPNIG